LKTKGDAADDFEDQLVSARSVVLQFVHNFVHGARVFDGERACEGIAEEACGEAAKEEIVAGEEDLLEFGGAVERCAVGESAARVDGFAVVGCAPAAGSRKCAKW
jgi:hypothetical protein